MLLERFLPAPPARVLDIGGASGVYASWLSGRGYQVHLIDPVRVVDTGIITADGFHNFTTLPKSLDPKAYL